MEDTYGTDLKPATEHAVATGGKKIIHVNNQEHRSHSAAVNRLNFVSQYLHTKSNTDILHKSLYYILQILYVFVHHNSDLIHPN